MVQLAKELAAQADNPRAILRTHRRREERPTRKPFSDLYTCAMAYMPAPTHYTYHIHTITVFETHRWLTLIKGWKRIRRGF